MIHHITKKPLLISNNSNQSNKEREKNTLKLNSAIETKI